jgi:hypothetical protein
VTEDRRESEEAFGAGQDPRPEYIEGLHVVLRSAAEWDGELEEALVAMIDVGGSSPLPNIVPEVERWLADRGQALLTVETRVQHVHAGAAGVGAELIVALIGSASTVTVQELWRFIRRRLEGEHQLRQEADWYHSLEPGESADPIAQTLAQALDRRRAELTLVELRERPDAITAVYEVAGTGSHYRVTVEENAHSIVRLSD